LDFYYTIGQKVITLSVVTAARLQCQCAAEVNVIVHHFCCFWCVISTLWVV